MITINYWAVFLAALAPMVIGMFWYSPVLFGQLWMKMVGITDKKAQEIKEKGMGFTYLYMFLACMTTAYVMANLLALMGIKTIGMGVMAGFWMWLGFVAPVSLSGYLFAAEKKPVGLYFLENGFQLVSFMVQAAVLAYF